MGYRVNINTIYMSDIIKKSYFAESLSKFLNSGFMFAEYLVFLSGCFVGAFSASFLISL